MKAYKGFNKDLQCRDFQFEIGKEYEENEASLCNKGFHACEYSLDCFNYYAPANSRFCEVELDATEERHGDDSKVCGSKIKIGAEIGIPGLVKAAIEYTKAHITTEHTDLKAATAGYKGAATAGGSAESGENGLSVARGKDVKVKGGIGAVLVIVEENYNNYDIKEWASAVVDGKKIKPDVWYSLKNGEFVESDKKEG